ncbi:MAG: elongation factor G [bacterium]|nr:elongation factor G [bacterium]
MVEKIRNVTLIGHGGSGKTTLCEAIFYKTGIINRMGSIDQGNTLMDYDEEEIKRKSSIRLAVGYIEHDGYLINLIDTPGYLDFAGEVVAGIKVADNAVVVVDATSGVEVGTEKYFEMAKKKGIPIFLFINKMTGQEINLDGLWEELKNIFGHHVTPFQIPLGKGASFKGVFDLVAGDVNSLPSDVREYAVKERERFRENIIETSEDLLEKYMAGEEITDAELMPVLKKSILNQEIIPVFYGDAKEAIGIIELLNGITSFGASPLDAKPEVGKLGGSDVEIKADPDGKAVAFVFKTFQEAHLGEVSIIKVLSGKIESGKEYLNSRTQRTEKVNQMYMIRGADRKEVPSLTTGMIGALVKLKDTKTNDTLSDKDFPIEVEKIVFPEPLVSIAIIPESREDQDKVSDGLNRLKNEDPTIDFRYDPELKQTLLWGLGEIHLDVVISRLKEKYGVNVRTEKPKIPYRESIRKTAEGFGKYVKQTGGHGQYGICNIRIEPLPRGGGYEFVNQIFGGAIPNNFIPAVETGVKKAMEAGVLAGAKVVDVRVVLYDGKYHPVDSSNLAFEIAGSLAFKDAQAKADPYLLEPIYELEVTVPEEFMGDVIGDINARRGKIQGMDSQGRYQVIRALVPLAELYKYSSTLRSITKGRGTYTMRFSHYDEVPAEIAKKIIEEAKKEKKEE